MKYFFTGIVLSVFWIQLSAQQRPKDESAGKGKITGSIIDSASKTAIEYATISIFLPNQKRPVTGTTSDSKGAFVVRNLAPGKYRMVIDFIGYNSRVADPVTVGESSSAVSLGTIILAKKQDAMQAVTVIGQKPLVESKIDKLVYNAERDLTSQGGVATDILKKIPQISVDVDGNVELAGSSSIRFLINGKPSTAFGNNIADVLQSIPASQIKSIEVITNPGAKYDAEGLGGIINIILKQNTAQGINGNLSLSAGSRLENGSFNFNARKGNFGLNAFISGNARLAANTPSNSQRTSLDTVSKAQVQLDQEGSYLFKRHGLQSGLGFDWTYRKKNNFSGSVNYNLFGNNGNGSVNQTQVTTVPGNSGDVLSSVSTYNPAYSSFRFYNVDANLNYKRTFEKEDQELSVAVNSSYGNNLIHSSSTQYWQPQDSLFFGTQSTNPGEDRQIEGKIDYTQPLAKKTLLGVGGKIDYRDITSASQVLLFQPSSNTYLYDSALSNNLNYKQTIYALYTEISFPVWHLFDAKIGGRYERTNINSYYSNAPQQVPEPGYNTFVPAIFFSRKLDDRQTVRLSYSKRISRPDYRDLNPFVNTVDPKNITAGNPYLQPEIGNRFELAYNRDLGNSGSFMVTAFYRTSDHDIQPYIVYYPTLQVGDSVYYNVAVSMPQNIGLEKDFGVNLFGNLRVGQRINVRSNVFLFSRHTINAIDPGYNSNSFNYRINVNGSYQFPHDLAAEFFGNFSSPRSEVQGKYPSFFSYTFAFRKQFMNKKASIALTATNPFNEYVNQRTSLYGPNFTQTGLRQVPYRSFGINLTWKFGKLEFKKEKEQNSAPEESNG